MQYLFPLGFGVCSCMSFDSFFKELKPEKNLENNPIPVCKCSKSKMEGSVSVIAGKYEFEGCCSAEKACFIIQFDCQQCDADKIEIVSARAEKTEKEVRLTLDKFLGIPQTSRDTSRDIPRPPPPQADAKPSDA